MVEGKELHLTVQKAPKESKNCRILGKLLDFTKLQLKDKPNIEVKAKWGPIYMVELMNTDKTEEQTIGHVDADGTEAQFEDTAVATLGFHSMPSLRAAYTGFRQ